MAALNVVGTLFIHRTGAEQSAAKSTPLGGNGLSVLLLERTKSESKDILLGPSQLFQQHSRKQLSAFLFMVIKASVHHAESCYKYGKGLIGAQDLQARCSAHYYQISPSSHGYKMHLSCCQMFLICRKSYQVSFV